MNYTSFIGIDVSQKTIDVAIKTSGVKDLSTNQFSNAIEGFKKMLAWIEDSVGMPIRNDSLFCLGHTGLYSLPLDCFLSRQGLHYTLQPGVQVKSSMGYFQRGKTDEGDAKA